MPYQGMPADPLTMEKNAHDLVRSHFPSKTAGKSYSLLVRTLDEILTRLAQTLNYPPAYEPAFFKQYLERISHKARPADFDAMLHGDLTGGWLAHRDRFLALSDVDIYVRREQAMRPVFQSNENPADFKERMCKDLRSANLAISEDAQVALFLGALQSYAHSGELLRTKVRSHINRLDPATITVALVCSFATDMAREIAAVNSVARVRPSAATSVDSGASRQSSRRGRARVPAPPSATKASHNHDANYELTKAAYVELTAILPKNRSDAQRSAISKYRQHHNLCARCGEHPRNIACTWSRDAAGNA